MHRNWYFFHCSSAAACIFYSSFLLLANVVVSHVAHVWRTHNWIRRFRANRWDTFLLAWNPQKHHTLDYYCLLFLLDFSMRILHAKLSHRRLTFSIRHKHKNVLNDFSEENFIHLQSIQVVMISSRFGGSSKKIVTSRSLVKQQMQS